MNVAPNGGQGYWLLTDRLTVKLGSRDTGGAFALVEVVGQPDFGPPPHIHHRQDECFCIQDGTFEFTYEGKKLYSRRGLCGPPRKREAALAQSRRREARRQRS